MKDKAIYVRVNPEVKKQIESLAEKDGRSISNYVNLLIVEHLTKININDKIIKPDSIKSGKKQDNEIEAGNIKLRGTKDTSTLFRGFTCTPGLRD